MNKTITTLEQVEKMLTRNDEAILATKETIRVIEGVLKKATMNGSNVTATEYRGYEREIEILQMHLDTLEAHKLGLEILHLLETS